MSTVAAATDLAAGCKVTLAGSAMDPTLGSRVMEVRVETTVGLPDVCTIRLAEDPDAGGTLTVIDDNRFALAAPVTVKLAKAVGGQLGEVFDGEITTIEAELGSSLAGDPVMELTVTAHDRSHRMHRKTTTRTFRQMTVTDVARKMAGEHGVKVGALANLPGGAAEERHQVGETDWEYLSRLVTSHGGELDVAAGALNIIDPSKTKAAAAELVYGETLQRFRPRVSALGQAAKVNVSGWDIKKKKVISKPGTPKASTTTQNARSTAPSRAARCCSPATHVSTDAEADARAKAAAMRLGHERVQGRRPPPAIRCCSRASTSTINGVGTRFGGTHRIVSAVHVYGRAATSRSSRSAPAAGRSPRPCRAARRARASPTTSRSGSSPTTRTPTSSGV